MKGLAKFVALVGVVIVLAGCTRQVFITEADYEHYRRLMPANLENDPTAAEPQVEAVAPPHTVLDPEKREPYYLSLAEAIAIALERGTTGVTSVAQPGQVSNDLLDFQRVAGVESASDSNRVLALRPAIEGAGLEANLARFDPKWVTNIGWRVTDQQVQGLGSFTNGQTAHFESGLIKPLATGGVAGITFSTDYTNLAQPPTFFPIQNPAYLTKLTFGFEQPLWKDFGVDINQIISRHPGTTVGTSLTAFGSSFLNSHLAGITGATGSAIQPTGGILIARLRFDQSRAEFERIVNFKLLNVETAYWNLYGAYINLYAAEQGLRLARVLWQTTYAQAKAGVKNITLADAKRAEGQFRLFQGDRVAALNDVLEKERTLRRLMGLPPDDGKQLIPIDAPTLAAYRPDWHQAVQEALTMRPELVMLRQELKKRQLGMQAQKNLLNPDLRLVSGYEITGLGSRLDGNGTIFDQSSGIPRTNNAFRSLLLGDFTNWNVGLTLNVPLGFRAEHASVRAARLALAAAHLALKNEEDKALSYLAKTYRDVISNYELIKIRRAQRLSFAEQLKKEQALQLTEKKVFSETTLQAQRDFVNALTQEFQAIVAYNNALAAFQFAKGTIMRHNNVQIGEGKLPECAVVRAVEHERQRARAIVLRERAQAVPHLPVGPEGTGSIPVIPEDHIPSIPSFLEGSKIAPDAPANDGGTGVAPAPETLHQEAAAGASALPPVPTPEVNGRNESLNQPQNESLVPPLPPLPSDSE